jgi:hypothetical protein
VRDLRLCMCCALSGPNRLAGTRSRMSQKGVWTLSILWAPDRRRTGPYSACFRGSPVFAGLECSSSPTSGTHSPLVRGGFALPSDIDPCSGPSDAGPWLVPGAAAAHEVVWVAGSGPWPVGPPSAGMWGHSGLLSGLFRRPWLVLYLFMPCGSDDDMT